MRDIKGIKEKKINEIFRKWNRIQEQKQIYSLKKNNFTI